MKCLPSWALALMKQTINILLVFTACIIAALSYFEHLQHNTRRARLHALQREINQIENSLQTARARLKVTSGSEPAVSAPKPESGRLDLVEEVPSSRGKMDGAPQHASSKGMRAPTTKDTLIASGQVPEWLVSERVDQIAGYVEISDDERKMLKEVGKTGLKGELSNAELIEAMEGILGYERTFQLINRYREDFELKHELRIEDEIYVMSRRFSLSSAQEDEVRKVLQEVQAELSSIPADEEEGKDKSTLELISEQRDEKLALLIPRLHEILSEEQYQSFMDYQNNDPAKFFP